MTEEQPTFDELMHYGIRGMRWGVRREDPSGSSGAKTPVDHSARNAKIKKAAIILGSAAAITAVAAGAYYVSKNSNLNLSSLHLADIRKGSEMVRGEQFSKSFSKEPVGIIHAARGKSVGFTFPGRGGLENPLREYEAAFGADSNAQEFFSRYGDNLEKVAAKFYDPEGRKDRAGRAIFHDVILPKDLAVGVNSAEEAKNVAWPLIKDTYQALYDRPGSN